MTNLNPTKAAIKHCKDLLNPKHVFTKQQINAIAKALNRLWRNPSDANASYILATLELRHAKDIENKITKEQKNFGLEYLKSIQLKKSNRFKKGSGFEHCNFSQKQIVQTAKDFRFIGFMPHKNGMGEYMAYTPIYDIIGKNGGRVDYSPIHWSPAIVYDCETAGEHCAEKPSLLPTIEDLRALGILK